jgi:DNA repair photolyase
MVFTSVAYPAVPMISEEERALLVPELLDVVDYRKSGLSLNHIIGCPLQCAYCVRHLFDSFGMKRPTALMSDEEAVARLVGQSHFQPNLTPLQLFNRATDPMLPTVKPHTFRCLELLDEMGLKNHVLVITRFIVEPEDCERLNGLKNIRLSVLVTYSGIDDERIEPISNEIPARSLETLGRYKDNYGVVLCWRPLVPGLNDSDAHIARVVDLSRHADAVVFTGLFFREEMKCYFEKAGLPELYDDTARRKILPRQLEANVIRKWQALGGLEKLFRKTSCGIGYAHGVTDYNGHFGIREICGICPPAQIEICASNHRQPSPDDVAALLGRILDPVPLFVVDRQAITIPLREQDRYYLQHGLNYQAHHPDSPHNRGRHGRAEIGWGEREETR